MNTDWESLLQIHSHLSHPQWRIFFNLPSLDRLKDKITLPALFEGFENHIMILMKQSKFAYLDLEYFVWTVFLCVWSPSRLHYASGVYLKLLSKNFNFWLQSSIFFFYDHISILRIFNSIGKINAEGNFSISQGN